MNEINKIRIEKIKEYKENHNVPEFSNPDEYMEWLKTPQGKAYSKELEKIRGEATKTIHGRGGYRPNAGRKKLADKVAIHKRINKNTVILIKDFSKKHSVSENEALDQLINAGYEYLKQG